jgi:hypothetical protein
MPYFMFKSGCKKFDFSFQDFKNGMRFFKVELISSLKGW